MAIKFGGGISKTGEAPVPAPRPIAPQHRSIAPALPMPLSHARRFQGAFSLREARHNFIVEILPKPAWNKSRPYLYTCARCKWAFRVNESPGSIVPLDGKGEPLAEPLRDRRIATFAEGPCGAFPAYALERPAQRDPRGWIRRTLVALLSRRRADATPV